jgi:hypothetical protein
MLTVGYPSSIDSPKQAPARISTLKAARPGRVIRRLYKNSMGGDPLVMS